MGGRRGRSNAQKLARMGRILLLLRAHPAGLTTQELLERVGYGDGPRESRMRALHRDLAALTAGGWRIDTDETANTPARRTLRMVDNRFAALFTPAQRAELARAALCAGDDVADALAADLGRAPAPPAFRSAASDGVGRLAVCQSAAADRCLLRFTYNGTPRVVHPIGVLLRPGGWYLRGLDSGDDTVKQFAVDRMRRLTRDAPGSASPPSGSLPEPIWDFMRRPVHAPVTATLETTVEHLPDVLSATGTNGYDVVATGDPAQVRLEVVVTNRRAMVDRVLALGTRVRLLGPEDLRAELRDRLVAWADRP